jgi:RNA polymerase sigma-70 factor, ECF subfamily
MNSPNSIPLWPAELGSSAQEEPTALPSTPALYAEHAALVWRALVHLGVPEADREDLLQEVFVVVHQSRHNYQGRGQLTSWLYGIALRVASRHRRRERVRRGNAGAIEIHPVELRTPEHVLLLRQRADLLQRILERLSSAKREVFVLFEIQGLSTDQVSSVLGVPRGTVFSRLHAAREEFLAIWRELETPLEKEQST